MVSYSDYLTILFCFHENVLHTFLVYEPEGFK